MLGHRRRQKGGRAFCKNLFARGLLNWLRLSARLSGDETTSLDELQSANVEGLQAFQFQFVVIDRGVVPGDDLGDGVGEVCAVSHARIGFHNRGPAAVFGQDQRAGMGYGGLLSAG